MFVNSPQSRATILSLLLFLPLHPIEPSAFAESMMISFDQQLVWGVAFSFDDRYVIATGQDGVVLMWERESCGLHTIIVPTPITDKQVGSHTITGVAWSPTKLEFAAAMRDGSVRLWQVARVGKHKIEEIAVYARNVSSDLGHVPGMRSVAFSPDGSLLAAAGHGSTIYVWRTGGASVPVHILNGQAGQINTVAFGRDNSTLISAGNDGLIHFWDLERETEVRTIKTPDPVYNAAVSPNRRYIVASSGWTAADTNNTVVYDFDTGEEVRRFRRINKPFDLFYSQTFSPDNRFVAIGTWGGDGIHLFGLEQEQEIWVTQVPNEGIIMSLAFSHSGKFLLAGVTEDAPYLLDAKTGVILKRYGGAACDFEK